MPQTDKQLQQSFFTGQIFFDDDILTFCFGVYKDLEWRVPQTDKQLQQSFFTGQIFFDDDILTFCFGVYKDNKAMHIQYPCLCSALKKADRFFFVSAGFLDFLQS